MIYFYLVNGHMLLRIEININLFKLHALKLLSKLNKVLIIKFKNKKISFYSLKA